jgi:CSLREA domain-containing protein
MFEDRLAPAVLVVNTAADDTSADSFLSLREAINAVNIGSDSSLTAAQRAQITGTFGSNDTIQFDSSLHGQTISLQDGVLALKVNVTIDGPGTSLLTISGQNKSTVLSVASGASAVLSGLTIADGNAGKSASGGGIYNAGTLTVTQCTITGSSALNGAGINNSGTLTLSDSTISNNSALYDGGGIRDLSSSATPPNSTVTGCTISGNTSGIDGGGLFDSAGISLVDCTISGNSAPSGNGGGTYSRVLNGNAGTSFSDCTISGNSASVGGGFFATSASGQCLLTNTLVVGNSAGSDPDARAPVDAGSSYNLIGIAQGLTGISTGSQGNQIGTVASPINAILGSLANYGGDTPTIPLLPGSPAIDAGNPDTTGLPSVDQRGFARVVNGQVDVGAFESRGFTLKLTGGNNQSAFTLAPFAKPLAATVSSPFGDPVTGGIITFNAPASGASVTFAGANTALISATGAVSVAVRANSSVGSYTVTASATGTNSASFTLTNNAVPATSIVISSLTSSTTAGVAQTFLVTLKDGSGNAAYDYTGTVQFTSSDPIALLPAEYTFTAADAGMHVFSVTLETAGKQSIQVADTGNGLLTTKQSVSVLPAVVSAFALSGLGTTTVAGTVEDVRVGAVDQFGNSVPTYLGTVRFSSNDVLLSLPANYIFTAADHGVHTFALKLKTAGARTVTTTDTANASVSGSESVIVEPASATKLFISGVANPSVAGALDSFFASVEDMYGNTVPTYTGTIDFSTSDAQATLPSSYVFVPGDRGAHLLTITFRTSGSQSLTATDPTSTLTTFITKTTVVAGALVGLTLTGFANGAIAGVAQTITVVASDTFGNAVPTYTGTIHFRSSDFQAVLPADYTFTAADAGVHTFLITLNTLGDQDITASDKLNPAIVGNIFNVPVSPGFTTAQGLPIDVTSGLTFTGNVATFSVPPQLGLTPSQFSATIAWGDGQSSAGTITLNSNSVFTVSGSHSYAALGTPKVTTTIQFQGGAQTTVSTNATIGSLDELFVSQLYEDLLDRAADLGSLVSWSNNLDQGFLTRIQVASAIIASVEYRTDETTNAYETILGRQPDSGGLEGALAFLANGGTFVQLEANLYGSAEFFQKNGNTVTGFLAALYQDALGRAIDPASEQQWTQALANGATASSVAANVLVSVEAETNFVAGVFMKFLHRAPSATESLSYVEALQNGSSEEALIAMLTGSAEYAEDAGGDANVAYVTQLYTSLLGRPVDAGSLVTFSTGLDDGQMTRAQVVQALLGSTEYQNDVVTALYERYLGRSPDAAGLALFSAQLASGASDETVAAELIGSDEFYQTNGGTNAGFLAALYQDALGRAIDAGGESNWENALQNGTTRAQVATAIFGSAEYQGDVVQAAYQNLLSRAPTSTELANGLSLLQSGGTDEAISAAIAKSSGYFVLA